VIDDVELTMLRLRVIEREHLRELREAAARIVEHVLPEQCAGLQKLDDAEHEDQ